MKNKIFYGFVSETFDEVKRYIEDNDIKDVDINITSKSDGSIFYIAILKEE